jgi:Omp85 superfamily domain
MLSAIVFSMALWSSDQAAGDFQTSVRRVVAVSVQGNTLTPDEEIVRLAGVQLGMPAAERTAGDAADRLRSTGRFEKVQVLERFASIADPSQIVLVIVVDEGPVEVRPSRDGAPAQTVRNRSLPFMFLPLFDYEDGYGLSYGVRVAIPDLLGERSRMSFPATWGGDKRAAVELDKSIGASADLRAGASVSRREHPFFEVHDDRRRVWLRGEREIGGSFRAGATGAWQRVSFQDRRDEVGELGADIVFDTRTDPVLARNAVFARAAVDRIAVEGEAPARRTLLDARGYVGMVGQSVLELRVARQDSNRPLPPYMQPMLGGTSNVRGFRAGTAVGDTLLATAAELRVPLTSPMSIGKLGVSGFFDAATIYVKGQRLRDQRFYRGAGASVWFAATVFRINVSVAHGFGGATRVHFGTTAVF